MLAVIVTAAVIWGGRDRTPGLLTNEARPALSAFVTAVEAFEPTAYAEVAGIRSVHRPSRLAALEPDHERGLEALSVNALVAETMPENGFLALEPLAIEELPLTAESFPER